MPDLIVGWRPIAAYLARRLHVAVSRPTFLLWEALTDPLPTRHWNRRPPNVYALTADLDAWITRNRPTKRSLPHA